MMLALPALLLALMVGADLPEPVDAGRAAVRVDQRWRATALSAKDLQVARALDGAEGIWLWSSTVAPTRWPVDRRPPATMVPTREWLEVRFETGRLSWRADLRLLAAPVAMWEEVPEELIPSFPVPPVGLLRVPRPTREPWRLRLVGPGIGTTWATVPAGRRDTVLRLMPAADRQLSIVNGEGDSLTDLVVRVFPGLVRDANEVMTAYRTDAHGDALLPSLPGEAEMVILAMHPGARPVAFSGRLFDLPRELRLAPGATLRGRLVDADDNAVVDARIRVLSVQAAASALVIARTAVSDEDGTWQVDGLQPGQAQLTVVGRGYARLNRILDLSGGTEDLGQIILGKARTVELSIFDHHGTPISEAKVSTVAD